MFNSAERHMERRDRREGRRTGRRGRGLPEGFLTLDSDEDADPSRLLAQRRRRKVYDEDQQDDNPYEEVSTVKHTPPLKANTTFM